MIPIRSRVRVFKALCLLTSVVCIPLAGRCLWPRPKNKSGAPPAVYSLREHPVAIPRTPRGAELAGLARTPWPKAYHDLQNRSRSPLPGPRQPTMGWSAFVGDYRGSGVGPPAVGENGVVCRGADSERVNGFTGGGTVESRTTAGKLSWSLGIGSVIGSSPAFAGDGVVYVNSDDGFLYAIDPGGRIRWRVRLWEKERAKLKFVGVPGVWDVSPSISRRGVVFTPTTALRGNAGTEGSTGEDSRLYAVSPNGKVLWRMDLPGQAIDRCPAVASDGSLYLTTSRWLYALDEHGTVRWRRAVGDWSSQPLITDDGSVVICDSGRVLKLFTSGKLIWRRPIGGARDLALGWHGDIYVGCDALIDKARLGKQESIAGWHGDIYIAGAPGGICSLTAGGRIRWWVCQHRSISGVPVVDRDGNLYVGLSDGFGHEWLSSLTKNGVVRWRYKFHGDITGSAIGAPGQLYVTARNHHIYSLGDRRPESRH
ncbi:MAG TPA: PQQ-binding-like beta-propeller repeat protein [Armatimonadota bacterium]|nr:PQQ-binding-like beta-propeller repeat protein [Armatimonadota bacterium]